ncbi:MAG: hypothetical protein GYA55_04410 [SAR324 cluster bacterium]|uniref:Uncharacterized protein n=1 Tax=SAR324 cluster bacterium TaxID=2024889 RepID=A0A7X9FQE6_9DELT|nr:hypothetical protein [SAR324 cluster bacterium]
MTGNTLWCIFSGPIDFDRANTSWRDEWTQGLIDLGFKKEQIFNPCRKPLPKGMFEFDLDSEAEVCAKYRKAKDYESLCRVMNQIAHVDLRLVDKSDLVLANFTKMSQESIQPIIDEFEEIFSKEVIMSAPHFQTATKMRGVFYKLVTKYLSLQTPTYGTIHEIVNATIQHKPTMVVWKGGKETCSYWMMWLVGHNNVFDSFDALTDRLKSISEGKVALNVKDWMLFDFGRGQKLEMP